MARDQHRALRTCATTGGRDPVPGGVVAHPVSLYTAAAFGRLVERAARAGLVERDQVRCVWVLTEAGAQLLRDTAA